MPDPSAPCSELVVIGASAGGLEVVRGIVSGLPPDFPAAVGIVIHIAPTGPGLLPAILRRAGRLPVAYATDGKPLECGHVYVAPPNRHFLVRAGRARLGSGPRENGFRPAIDPLFRSAAESYGPHVIGVICSGAMDDGTAGLEAIKRANGWAVVQNPETALVPSMPRSAMHNVPIDCVLDAPAIAPELVRLVPAPRPAPNSAADPAGAFPADLLDMAADVGFAEGFDRSEEDPAPRCPDCGGPMHEVPDAHVLRYRCHEGHGYAAGSLFAKQVDQNGMAIRQLVSALRERAALGHRMADRAARRGDREFADFVLRTVARVEQRAERLSEELQESESDPEIDIT